MKIAGSIFNKGLLFLLALILVSCAEPLGTGAKVDLTYVAIECKTPKCLSYSFTANAIVKITSASCDPAFDHWAAASTSLEVTCNPITGCTGNSSDWVDNLGKNLNQLPSGSYTICGFIDFNDNYPLRTDDDATIEIQSFRIDGVTPIVLKNWVDPN